MEADQNMAFSGNYSDCTVDVVTDKSKEEIEEKIKVPALRRTRSVFLTKEMLQKDSADLTSSPDLSDSSEDSYIPESSEESSDQSCEEDCQPPTAKRRRLGEDFGKLQKSQAGIESEKTCGLSNTKKKTKRRKEDLHLKDFYRKSLELCEMSETEDVAESRLKTKPKRSDKRGSCSEEQNESASAKKDRNRKTYTRMKNSQDSQSVVTNNSLVVADVPKESGSKKYHRKKNYCIFCKEPQSKIARHLERKHGDKIEVSSALMYPKKSKQRRNLLNLLRRKGNRAHNIEAITHGKGTLVPCKQQSGDRKGNPNDYQHCFACFGLFKRKSLWKHAKRCSLAQEIRSTMPGKTRIQSLCAASQPVSKEVNMKVAELLNSMTQDEVAHAVRMDPYILKVGEKMFNRQRETASQHENVRQIMRGLGRLVIAGKEVTPLTKMEEYIHPQNFHFVIRAVKQVTGFDEDRNKFQRPTLATKLGQSIQRVADIMEAEALSSQNNEKKQLVQEFRRMYSLTWNEMISSAAYRTVEEKKWNKPKLIPLADDVKKMHIYMAEKHQEYYGRLWDQKNSKNWANLAKVILAQIILFNRRREGEVSKMLLETFVNRDKSSLNDDVAEALSELEKKLCHHFERMEIRGKRGRKVPIILTPGMVQSLEVLTKERNSCGVGENPFLFARPGFNTALRGADCIREFARNCGAKKPEALSSTKLRRQVATLSRVLNLNDTEQDLLADFLGHDIRVHRKFYRLPEGTLHLAKISKVLMACEQGRLAEFQGKNLDQISIKPNDRTLTVEESSGRSDDDDDQTEPFSRSQDEPQPSQQQLEDDQHLGEVPESEPDTSSQQLSEKKLLKGKSPRWEIEPSSSQLQLEDDLHGEVPGSGPDTSSQQLEQKKLSKGKSPQTENEPRPSKQQHSGGTKKTKKMWSTQEVKAVEKTLKDFIRMGKTPGKKDCEECLAASPEALAYRDWRSIKFYVHNRIVSEKRM